MSVPNQYFGHGSHMSAVLKQDIARVKRNRPDLFALFDRTETSMDGEGKVTSITFKDTEAKAITPTRRHALSVQKHGF